MNGRRSSCPTCGSTSVRPLVRYASAHLERCNRCKLAFAVRLPTDAELTSTYEDYGHAWEDSAVTRSRYRELLDSFESFRKNNRLLDFGCGAGFFLEEARARGWEVRGIEHSRYAVELCRSKELDVRSGALHEHFANEEFDVITAFEVFEHLREPEKDARELARILRPQGHLYATTPNFDSLSRRALGPRWSVIEYPEHLLYHTPRSLGIWLERNGFRVSGVTTTGISPWRVRASLPGGRDASRAYQSQELQLRTKIERSDVLKLGKRAGNILLSITRTGDTVKIRCVRI